MPKKEMDGTTGTFLYVGKSMEQAVKYTLKVCDDDDNDIKVLTMLLSVTAM